MQCSRLGLRSGFDSMVKIHMSQTAGDAVLDSETIFGFGYEEIICTARRHFLTASQSYSDTFSCCKKTDTPKICIFLVFSPTYFPETLAFAQKSRVSLATGFGQTSQGLIIFHATSCLHFFCYVVEPHRKKPRPAAENTR